MKIAKYTTKIAKYMTKIAKYMTKGLIQTSMNWMCLRWRSRMVMIWYFDNKSPLTINIFLPCISNGQLLSLDNICLCFSAIGCFQTSWYFPTKSHLIVIFFSLLEFAVATAEPFCFAWLLQYWSTLVHYQICWRRWC